METDTIHVDMVTVLKADIDYLEQKLHKQQLLLEVMTKEAHYWHGRCSLAEDELEKRDRRLLMVLWRLARRRVRRLLNERS